MSAVLAHYDLATNRFTQEGVVKKITVANVLPRDARDALIAAAAVNRGLPAGESQSRTRELEGAIERVKRNYPAYFQQEKES